MKQFTDADITVQIPCGEDTLKEVSKAVISIRDEEGNILHKPATIEEDTVSVHLSPIDFNIIQPGIIDIEASLFDENGEVSKTETVKDRVYPSVAGEVLLWDKFSRQN